MWVLCLHAGTTTVKLVGKEAILKERERERQVGTLMGVGASLDEGWTLCYCCLSATGARGESEGEGGAEEEDGRGQGERRGFVWGGACCVAAININHVHQCSVQ